MMNTHWHDFNPWKDKVVYISDKHARLLQSDEYIDALIQEYGNKLDYYLLPQPNDRYSMGIRYGKKDREYMSPYVNDGFASVVMELYVSKAALEFLDSSLEMEWEPEHGNCENCGTYPADPCSGLCCNCEQM